MYNNESGFGWRDLLGLLGIVAFIAALMLAVKGLDWLQKLTF